VGTRAIADAVCAALEVENIGCWIAPRDVQGGRPYFGQITQAIRETRVLLLILAEAANRSKHVLQEVERAAHCQKPPFDVPDRTDLSWRRSG
jgi:hypothetical protein